MVQVGAVGGTTVTVSEQVAVAPALLVTVSVYVVVTLGDTERDPAVATEPID